MSLPLCVSDQKPLSVEVGEASALMLLGAEQENAELKRRLEELQAQQEVRVHQLDGYDSQKESISFTFFPRLKVKEADNSR